MKLRPLLVSAVLGLSVLGGGLHDANAQVRGSIGISVGTPPPLRYERVVARVGYNWAPGFWRWYDPAQNWVWVGGYYQPVAPVPVYYPAPAPYYYGPGYYGPRVNLRLGFGHRWGGRRGWRGRRW